MKQQEKDGTQAESKSSLGTNLLSATAGAVLGYVLKPDSKEVVTIQLPPVDPEDVPPIEVISGEDVTTVPFGGFSFIAGDIKHYADSLAGSPTPENVLNMTNAIILGTLGCYISDCLTASGELILHNIRRRHAYHMHCGNSRGKKLHLESAVHVTLDRANGLVSSSLLTPSQLSALFEGGPMMERKKKKSTILNTYAMLAKGLNTIISIQAQDGQAIGSAIQSIYPEDPKRAVLSGNFVFAIDDPRLSSVYNFMYNETIHIFVNPYSNVLCWQTGDTGQNGASNYANILNRLNNGV